eukprot:9158070-Lingulodinium_polyedra.AAC.1
MVVSTNVNPDSASVFASSIVKNEDDMASNEVFACKGCQAVNLNSQADKYCAIVSRPCWG